MAEQHLDELALALGNPAVGADERHDINREVFRTFQNALPSLGDVRDEMEALTTLPALYSRDAVATLFAKAPELHVGDRLTFDVYPDAKRFQLRDRDEPGHRSILEVNEYGVLAGMGDRSQWLERSVNSFEFLKGMVASVDVVKAILFTRTRQVSRFLRPESDQHPEGWHFVRADGEKIGRRDTAPLKRLSDCLLNSGDEGRLGARDRLRRDDLQGFVTKWLWNTLSYDAAPVELERTHGGKVSGWYNVPGDTVRLCSETGYEGDDQIRAIQVIDTIPYVAYGYPDILYPVRNPRADIWAGGYGLAELECMIRALTAYINAVTYNASGLDRNSTPRGILTLFGKFNAAQLRALRQQWKAMLTGATNRWVTPIMVSETNEGSAHYTPIDNNFNDMFFARWITLTICIPCALYGIDPNELHFDSFSVGRSSPLRGEDTEEKLAASQDSGFVPLLTKVESLLDTLTQLVDPRYLFRFVGLHREKAEQKAKRIELTRTVDEMREIDGAEPHPIPLIGMAPANNPALMGLYMHAAGAMPQTPEGQQGEQGPARQSQKPERDDEPPPKTGKWIGKSARVIDDFLVVIERENEGAP